MPEGSGIVDPFLASVRAGRAVKKIIHSRIGHIQEGNEICLRRNLLFGKEVHLRIQGLELFTRRIHA